MLKCSVLVVAASCLQLLKGLSTSQPHADSRLRAGQLTGQMHGLASK